jgi:hypothetical protein
MNNNTTKTSLDSSLSVHYLQTQRASFQVSATPHWTEMDHSPQLMLVVLMFSLNGDNEKPM